MEEKVIVEVNGQKSELVVSGPGMDRYGNAYDLRIKSGNSVTYIIAPKTTKEENDRIMESMHTEASRIFQNAILRGTLI